MALVGKREAMSPTAGEQCPKRRCSSCTRFGYRFCCGGGWEFSKFFHEGLDEIGDVTCHQKHHVRVFSYVFLCQDDFCTKITLRFGLVKCEISRNDCMIWVLWVYSTVNPPPLRANLLRSGVGQLCGGWWAKLASHRKRPGWPTWAMWIWLTFFCWIWWWPTCSLGLGATLASSSLSFLFGNMSRTGFANAMIRLGPWPNHYWGSTQAKNRAAVKVLLLGALFQADGFWKPFQWEIWRKEFLKNILHNLGFVKT